MAKGNIRYHTIGVPESQYEVLNNAKRSYEAQTGRNTDWGTFLGILGLGFLVGAGIYAVAKAREDSEAVQQNGHVQCWTLACCNCGKEMLWPKTLAEAECPYCGVQLRLNTEM